MANRRMLSKKITETDIFLDMPMSTQCLYFHLNMAADDEGFVSNPKTIKRTVGASDDDLKILIAKQFLFEFESGIVVIRDWKIHNYIQSDRFTETIYKDEKALLSEGKNKEYIKMYPECIQTVSTGKVSIELVKDSLELEEEKTIVKAEAIDYQAIVDKYHFICKSLPTVVKISDKRKKLIKAILKEYDMAILETAFFKTQQSDFLTGRSGSWKCGFDWLMNKNNLLKVIEGNYDNKQSDNAMDRLRENGGYNEQTIF